MRIFPIVFACLTACRPTAAEPVAASPTTPGEAPLHPPAPLTAPAYFSGAVELPGASLPFFVAVRPEGDGWVAAVDIPMQGARQIPAQDVAYDGRSLSFALDSVGAKWSVRLDDEGDSTECSLAQSGAAFPCTLAVVDEAAYAEMLAPKRPQTPKPPLPYPTREMTIDTGAVTLAGTLALPQGPGPHPAAVLVTGSGAQDRDETISDHKPFAVLAHHLAEHGIATLRLDDRGVGGSTGTLATSTTEDLAADVRAAHAWLVSQPEIAKDRVGVIGHSEGGIVGPAAAATTPGIAFVVMLAGTGVPGEQVVMKQTELIVRRSGMPEAQVAQAVEQQRAIFETLRTAKDEAAARTRVAEILGASGPVDDAVRKPQIDVLFSPWFRAFIAHDPRPVLAKLRVPVLALVGDLDLQVDAEQNLPAIEKALKKGKNRHATTRRMPGLNHLFQPAKTGLPAEYGMIEVTMSPVVLTLVSDWIGALPPKAERP